MPNLAGLSAVARVRLDVTGYRHQAPGFDPRSGEGARRHGGRFNPRESFPVIYLCTTTDCVRAEFRHSAERQGLAIASLLPRELWAIHLELGEILDLTNGSVLGELGLDGPALTLPNHEFTQQLGEAAHELRFQAIRSPSATGVDDVVAVFLENLGQDHMEAELLATWHTEAELNSDT